MRNASVIEELDNNEDGWDSDKTVSSECESEKSDDDDDDDEHETMSL